MGSEDVKDVLDYLTTKVTAVVSMSLENTYASTCTCVLLKPNLELWYFLWDNGVYAFVARLSHHRQGCCEDITISTSTIILTVRSGFFEEPSEQQNRKVERTGSKKLKDVLWRAHVEILRECLYL